MKKKALKITAFFLALTILAPYATMAGGLETNQLTVSSQDIDIDIATFEEAFAEIDALEVAILNDEVSTLEEAAATGIIVEKFNTASSITATKGFDWNNFDWPSGLWGFLCCPIGFFVVITNGNKTSDQKTSFWIGVAAGVVLNALSTPFVLL